MRSVTSCEPMPCDTSCAVAPATACRKRAASESEHDNTGDGVKPYDLLEQQIEHAVLVAHKAGQAHKLRTLQMF